MKKTLLFILLASYGFAGFSTTFTITNSGTTFTPATTTITVGDVVNFSLGSNHNAVEVSQATWDAKGNTPLAGGFSLPFGGGTVPAEKLTAGVHYYVCTPHAAFGMRGTITVLETTGLAENKTKEDVSIYPNPSNGNFHLQVNASPSAKKLELGIYTLQGKTVYSKTDVQQQTTSDIEISDLPKGVYILRLYGGKDSYYRKIVVK
jgi:plastocyanin